MIIAYEIFDNVYRVRVAQKIQLEESTGAIGKYIYINKEMFGTSECIFG